MNIELLLETAISAAKTAGNLLRAGFGHSFRIDSKEGRHNLVTEYDTRCEKIIIDTILSQFPDHRFLAEESGSTHQSNADSPQWIIDPLDGTVNFAHNIPIFCVSIAAEYRGELLCGVIYNPMLDELFTATRGGGAWLGREKIAVSTTEKLDDAILVTGFPYDAYQNPNNCIDHFADFIKLGLPIRRLGSAALDLAYLAAGRFDGFWEIRLNAWDVAAGKLIVEEAGGTVTDYDMSEHKLHNGRLLATNGKIHKEMSQILLQ